MTHIIRRANALQHNNFYNDCRDAIGPLIFSRRAFCALVPYSIRDLHDGIMDGAERRFVALVKRSPTFIWTRDLALGVKSAREIIDLIKPMVSLRSLAITQVDKLDPLVDFLVSSVPSLERFYPISFSYPYPVAEAAVKLIEHPNLFMKMEALKLVNRFMRDGVEATMEAMTKQDVVGKVTRIASTWGTKYSDVWVLTLTTLAELGARTQISTEQAAAMAEETTRAFCERHIPLDRPAMSLLRGLLQKEATAVVTTGALAAARDRIIEYLKRASEHAANVTVSRTITDFGHCMALHFCRLRRYYANGKRSHTDLWNPHLSAFGWLAPVADELAEVFDKKHHLHEAFQSALNLDRSLVFEKTPPNTANMWATAMDSMAEALTTIDEFLACDTR